MTTQAYREVNKILKEFSNITNRAAVDRGSDTFTGDYGASWQVYSIPNIEGVLLKVTRNQDSYGNSDTITSIEFVAAAEKTVITYKDL